MVQQFGRQANVLIGPAGLEAGIGVSDLRIVFNVEKTSKKTTNKAKVEIYNMSEKTFNKIAGAVLSNVLILTAGYANSGSLDRMVFAGDILRMSREKSGVDVVTTFFCSDGKTYINDRFGSYSYKAGTFAKNILISMIREMYNSPSATVQLPPVKDFQYLNGYSFIGKISDAVSEISEALGLDWSVQNNEIKVITKDSDNGERTVKLTPETGLIGSPVRINDSLISGQEESGEPGWKVESLLQPMINPNDLISIESEKIGANSFFKVVSVTHDGDTHGESWKTTTEVTGNGK